MTRYYSAKVDANQPELVAFLRKSGASVQSCARIGQGCLDLVIGYCGVDNWAEVKDPIQSNTARQLNESQQKWVLAWNGAKPWKLETTADCLELLAHMRQRAGKSINEIP